MSEGENQPAEVADQGEGATVVFDPWTELAAAPIPPLEIEKWVDDIFSPANIAKAKARIPDDHATAWREFTRRIEIEIDIDFPGDDPARALVGALFLLTIAERHALSRRHPHEFARLMGMAIVWLAECGIPDPAGVLRDLLAPDLFAALDWLGVHRPATCTEACGLDIYYAEPMPGIPEMVGLLSPEDDDPITAKEIISRIGMEDAVEEQNFPNSPFCALIIALLQLPAAECHALSCQHPREFVKVASLAAGWQFEDGEPDPDSILRALLAPELLDALNWLGENRPATVEATFGLGHLLH